MQSLIVETSRSTNVLLAAQLEINRVERQFKLLRTSANELANANNKVPVNDVRKLFRTFTQNHDFAQYLVPFIRSVLEISGDGHNHLPLVKKIEAESKEIKALVNQFQVAWTLNLKNQKSSEEFLSDFRVLNRVLTIFLRDSGMAINLARLLIIDSHTEHDGMIA